MAAKTIFFLTTSPRFPIPVEKYKPQVAFRQRQNHIFNHNPQYIVD